MTLFKWLASLTLASTTLATLTAEPRCPGNVAGLRLRTINRSQIIVPVMINHAGPYDFLVDTGTQATIVDPSLAHALQLESQGEIQVIGVGFQMSAPLSQLDSLSIGSQAIRDLVVVVQNLGKLQKADLHIRGILGGGFLKHLDVLIDYQHGVLCFDDENVIRPKLRGERIALVTPPPTKNQATPSRLLTIAVHLSGAQRPLLLGLDSGATLPLLFEPSKYLARGLIGSRVIRGLSGDGTERAFSVLSPQTLQIGRLSLHQISFIMLAGSQKDTRNVEVDGLLPTGLFRSIYISHADRFVVFEPW